VVLLKTKYLQMRYISTIISFAFLFNAYIAYSQDFENKIIGIAQHDIIFNFIQNNYEFNNKVVLYPYLGTTTFRDFEDVAAELVQLGFKKTDLFLDGATRSSFAHTCQNPLIVCIDTIDKYEKLSAEVIEAFELNGGNTSFNNGELQITEENIDLYSLSGLISGIYSKQLCEFKQPIFSVNNNFAILEYFIECGWLCGKGAILLLENKNNKWTKKRVLLSKQN
jgi:hypothetical protein